MTLVMKPSTAPSASFGNLFSRLPLVAEELEHLAISVFDKTTVLLLAVGATGRKVGSCAHIERNRPRNGSWGRFG
jgi:hypothetical protein